MKEKDQAGELEAVARLLVGGAKSSK